MGLDLPYGIEIQIIKTLLVSSICAAVTGINIVTA